MGTARYIEMDAVDFLPSSVNFNGGLSIELLGRGKASFWVRERLAKWLSIAERSAADVY
jgi:hypothetical protein